MEVHHHSHKPKNWKEHITEFIMLFAAVSLGFLAENVREHQIETKRGEVYLTELETDLRNDSIGLYGITFLIQNQKEAADSIYELYKNKNWESRINELYFFHAILSLRTNWEPNDATWEQAINSGTLRYLDNKELVKKLKEYYFQIKNMKNRENRILTMMDNYFEEYRQNHFVSPSITANKDFAGVLDIINKNTKPKMPVFTANQKILNRDKFDFETYVNQIARLQGTRNQDLNLFIFKAIDMNKELLAMLREESK
ncbi:MAG: hypothetical protein RL634_1045 [Bacteroidota bacterium]|jgi:hypothetical protein